MHVVLVFLFRSLSQEKAVWGAILFFFFCGEKGNQSIYAFPGGHGDLEAQLPVS